MAVYLQMHTLDRIRELNNCLMKKGFTVNFQSFSHYLTEKFDLPSYSERSFNRDMRDLKDLLAERFPDLEKEGELIKFSRARNEFYLIRENLTAFSGFSQQEMKQLSQSIELNKHLFTDGTGKGIFQKLAAIGLENRLSKYHQEVTWPVLQLIKDGERSGEQWLEPLMEKIYRLEVVELVHKGLKQSSGLKRLKGLPVLIKEYNNGWYTGWYLLFYPIKKDSHLVRPNVNDLWCFALDRILEVNSLPEKYEVRIPTDFKPNTYFDHILGIISQQAVGQKPERIELALQSNSWLLNYLKKYPIHASQKLLETEAAYIIELKMEINRELEDFIFQHLDEFQVRSPQRLKDGLRNRLKLLIPL